MLQTCRPQSALGVVPPAPAGSKQTNGDVHENSDDVVVIEHRPRGRHQGAAPRGRPRTRHERGRGPRSQGFGRPSREGTSRNGRSEVTAKSSVPPQPAGEELWDNEPAPQGGGASQGCVANQEEVRVPNLGDDTWGRVGVSERQVSRSCGWGGEGLCRLWCACVCPRCCQWWAPAAHGKRHSRGTRGDSGTLWQTMWRWSQPHPLPNPLGQECSLVE